VKLLRSEVSPPAKCTWASFTSLGASQSSQAVPASHLRSKNFTLPKTTAKTTKLLMVHIFVVAGAVK